MRGSKKNVAVRVRYYRFVLTHNTFSEMWKEDDRIRHNEENKTETVAFSQGSICVIEMNVHVSAFDYAGTKMKN